MSSAPAGWYPDPWDPRMLRYFDGAQWTSHQSPNPAAAPQGHAQPVVPAQQVHVSHVTVSAVEQQKSVGVAFLLTFFFGPLGLLYATTSGGAIAFVVLSIVVGIPLAFLTLGLVGLAIWVASIIWACSAVSDHNQRVVAASAVAVGPGLNFGTAQPHVPYTQPAQQQYPQSAQQSPPALGPGPASGGWAPPGPGANP